MEGRNIIFFVLLSLYDLRITFANKPSELPQGMFCEGCIATVKEILKMVNKKTGDNREVRVIDAMEDICNLQNFKGYEYSPPKTGQACKYLIENFDEEMERIFVKETRNFEKKICYELTKACEGVDRSKKPKEEMEVKIDNEKQQLHQVPGKEQETMQVNINDKGAAEKLIQQINESIKSKQENEAAEDEEEDDEDDEDDHKTDNTKTEL